MRGDSYWSARAAAPPEMFGEPDDDYPTTCDACGQPWAVHRAGFPAECRHVQEPPPPCPACGEKDRPCACDLAAYHAAWDAANQAEWDAMSSVATPEGSDAE